MVAINPSPGFRMINVSHEYGSFATVDDPGATAPGPQGSRGGEGTAPLLGAAGRLQGPDGLGVQETEEAGWAHPQRSLPSAALTCHLPPPARLLIYPCLVVLSSSKLPAARIHQSPALTSLSCPSWHMQPSLGSLLGLGSLEKSLPSRCWVVGSLGRSPSRGADSTGADFPLFSPWLSTPFLSWPMCSLCSVPTSPFTDYLWACLPVPLRKAVCLFPRSAPGVVVVSQIRQCPSRPQM